MTEYKQVILIRQDLKLPKGKIAAQAGHACVDAVLKQVSGRSAFGQGTADGSSRSVVSGRSAISGQEVVKSWRAQGMKKIALKVANEKELYKYVQQAKDIGLVTAVITDAGKTTVAPGTVTCAAIGPNEEEEIDNICKDIPLL
jgi:peptidyl-tRNA hydrolase, PTH2 family